MKILITTDWYSPVINGVVTSVLNLKDELVKSGHDVKILTLSNKRKPYRDGDVTYIRSVSVNKLYPKARVRLPFFNRWIKDILEWKPDIVHSQCEFSTFRLAKIISKRLSIPLVHTYHTVYEDYTHYFSRSKVVGKKLTKMLSRRICNKVEHVIVPTQKVELLLQSYSISKRISIVPSGIDIEKFNNNNMGREREILRSSLSIKENQPVLLYLGRLAKEKNVDEIIENLKEYKGEQIVLLIVGDGPYRLELEEKASGLDAKVNVIFVGGVEMDQTPSYYAVGDIYVSASNSETQGLTYIEAISSGLPLLCKKDDCLEGVLIEGENGFTFEDSEEFNKILLELLGSLEMKDKDMSNSSKIISKNYSREIFASNVEEIYRFEIERKMKAFAGVRD